MELIKKGSTEGKWFTFRAEGAPEDEKPARFKVRRVPSGFDRQTYYEVYGKRQEIRRKDGAVVSDIDVERTQRYQLALAVYALVDSENAEIPGELLPAGEAGSMVPLDGKWTEEIKRAVFTELPALARWVVECANSLVTQAAEEEASLGKTS